MATWHLHALYEQITTLGEKGAEICDLIERSLGAPSSFPIVYERGQFLEFARKAGVQVPRTQVLTGVADLEEWVSQERLPDGAEGKRNFWKCDGVRIVRNRTEGKAALRFLKAPPLLLRAIKRAVVNHDYTLIRRSALRVRSAVIAQSFVAGREATSALACWQGKVMAALHFEVLNKSESSGPATVLRLIENAEMSATAETIVRGLSLSGFHGLDYMLEPESGNAHLIEINPRSTQVGHLPMGPGRDLPAALFSRSLRRRTLPGIPSDHGKEHRRSFSAGAD